MNDTLLLLAPNSGFSLGLLLISISSRLGCTDGTNQRETESTFACKCYSLLYQCSKSFFFIFVFYFFAAAFHARLGQERVVLLHIIGLCCLPRYAHCIYTHGPHTLKTCARSSLNFDGVVVCFFPSFLLHSVAVVRPRRAFLHF